MSTPKFPEAASQPPQSQGPQPEQAPAGYQAPTSFQAQYPPYGDWSQVPQGPAVKPPQPAGLESWPESQPAQPFGQSYGQGQYGYGPPPPQDHPEAGKALGLAIAGLIFPLIGVYAFFVTNRLRGEVVAHNYQGRIPLLRADGTLMAAWICAIIGLVYNIFIVLYILLLIFALGGTLAAGQP